MYSARKQGHLSSFSVWKMFDTWQVGGEDIEFRLQDVHRRTDGMTLLRRSQPIPDTPPLPPLTPHPLVQISDTCLPREQHKFSNLLCFHICHQLLQLIFWWQSLVSGKQNTKLEWKYRGKGIEIKHPKERYPRVPKLRSPEIMSHLLVSVKQTTESESKKRNKSLLPLPDTWGEGALKLETPAVLSLPLLPLGTSRGRILSQTCFSHHIQVCAQILNFSVNI